MIDKYKMYNSAHAKRLFGQQLSQNKSPIRSRQNSNSKGRMTPYEHENREKMSNLQKKLLRLQENPNKYAMNQKTKTTNFTQ